MNKRTIWFWLAGSSLLLVAGASYAVMSGDLLTNSNVTTPWLNCEGSNLVSGSDTDFDPSHLDGAGCVYRETPAVAGEQYTMTCGVSSLKYSSMTLAFHDDSGASLVSETAEIFEDIGGGAYSVTLAAPAGTAFAAVGIYGLPGSGFQDCTLLLDNPDPTPVDGSIAGVAWFDESGDSFRAVTESLIPSTPVSLFSGDTAIAQTATDLNGAYYFGNLDLGSCYQLQFIPADPTVTFAPVGGDNDMVANGTTLDVCLTDAMPNVTEVDAGFIGVVPVTPPEDYAVCGETYLSTEDTVETIADVVVVLTNVVSGEKFETFTGTDGNYAFSNLPAGDYTLQFQAFAGFEFDDGSAPQLPSGIYADTAGMVSQFNLPAASNSGPEDACNLRNVNASMTRTVVALDPTIARDDHVSGFVGETLSILILANDSPCLAEVDSVDIIGHNVPGSVTYDAATRTVTVSATSAAGGYSIEYGLRGVCGSYDVASVSVELKAVPAPPPPEAPEAPKTCFASIGKLTGLEAGAHIDLRLDGGSHDDLASQYNLYDVNMELVYTGITTEAIRRDWGIFWRKREHGLEVFDVKYITASENGVESTPTECIRRQVTPVAIDVDRSGRVDSITGEFRFDVDGDGFEDSLAEWFDPADGILILKNFNSKVTGEHLFGDAGGRYADGFDKLSTLDRDNDGQLIGNELVDLAIWTDRNSNAVVDTGEVSSLEFHAIESLSVQHYKYVARATLITGETMLMRDVMFALTPVQQASN